ncbi:MAG TPA: alpha-amylase family glycosyl hydrolase, partial [Tenuifilaceae bacterium]|nr:alpha-amylase family glycosyl hydrolase [Tenuifilaceae bacterium]
MKKIVSFLGIGFIAFGLKAQPITVTPALPTDADAVTIVFDATKASRTDLVGYTGDVYAHTGVAINGRKWQYVIGSWGNNATQPKLTRTGTNTYTLSISPSIQEFYSVPADSAITQMCFVFRSADGTKQTEDIFYDVYEVGLSVSITAPTLLTPIYELNDNVQITASANNSTSLTIFIDNVEMATTTETSLTYTYPATEYGKHWIKAVASNNDQSVADSAYILVRSPLVTEELPAGMKPGVNVTSEQAATVVLYDPQALKNYAYLIGSFSDWLPDEQYYMKRTPDGKYFWVELNNLNPNQEYAFQFLIDGYLRIADPFTHKTLDPNDQYIPSSTYPGLMSYPTDKTYGIASVFSTAANTYTWDASDFTPPAKNNLIIYEMLIRDFVGDSYIQTAMDSLSYLKKLGVNAVELMPISEFEGNDSWGYNPSFYFAPDKAYGKANDYKAFIDEAHRQGMSVIMDIVLNHSFGQSPLVQLYSNSNGVTLGVPTTDNPWYNQTCPHEPFCWGYDFNHESPETRKFVDSVLTYWLTEYRVDGFRFDFSKGFTNTPNAGSAYDQARIDNLKRIADKVWSVNPNAYV